MSAVPVAVSAVTRPSTPTPSAESAWRIDRPESSSPTQPTRRTSAPRRRAATAWLAPLPPWFTRRVPSVTVSPGTGSRGAATVKSTLADPITKTWGAPIWPPIPPRARRSPAKPWSASILLRMSRRASGLGFATLGGRGTWRRTEAGQEHREEARPIDAHRDATIRRAGDASGRAVGADFQSHGLPFDQRRVDRDGHRQWVVQMHRAGVAPERPPCELGDTPGDR